MWRLCSTCGRMRKSSEVLRSWKFAKPENFKNYHEKSLFLMCLNKKKKLHTSLPATTRCLVYPKDCWELGMEEMLYSPSPCKHPFVACEYLKHPGQCLCIGVGVPVQGERGESIVRGTRATLKVY